MRKHLKKLMTMAAVLSAVAFGPVGAAHAAQGQDLQSGGSPFYCMDAGGPQWPFVRMNECNTGSYQGWTLQFMGYYTANGYNQNIWEINNLHYGNCLQSSYFTATTAACGPTDTYFIEVDDPIGHPHQFALAPYNNPGNCLHADNNVDSRTCDNAPSEWWNWL